MAISKILVPVSGTLDRTETLDLGLTVARMVSAHVEALHMQPNPQTVLLHATGYEPVGQTIAWIDANADALAQQIAERQDTARSAFQAWAARNGIVPKPPTAGEAVSAAWRECIGIPENVIADLGRFCDLIVLPRSDSANTARGREKIHAALFQACRPVLLTPPSPPQTLSGTAVVGWNASPEALRALTAALPLLSRMDRVILLCIGPTVDGTELPIRDEELLDYLACHGIRAEHKKLAADHYGSGSHLVHEARATGAAFFVMGAYTHSRTHEAILGGATRYVIEAAERPVLLAH